MRSVRPIAAVVWWFVMAGAATARAQAVLEGPSPDATTTLQPSDPQPPAPTDDPSATPTSSEPAAIGSVPPPAVEPDRPLTGLFPHLFKDLGRLVSTRDAALTLGAGVLLRLAVHPMDDHVTAHASAGGVDQIRAFLCRPTGGLLS